MFSFKRKERVQHREIKKIERIQQPLYDRVTMTKDEKNYKFFQNPIGSKEPLTGDTKTQVHTNLDTSGHLPYPKGFEIHAIRVITQWDADHMDIIGISDSWFRLFIGKKDELVINTFMLTTPLPDVDGDKCCLGCKVASTDVVSVTCGRPDQRGIYVLAEPIDLLANESFYVEMVFPKTPKIEKPTQVSVYLDGFIKREVE